MRKSFLLLLMPSLLFSCTLTPYGKSSSPSKTYSSVPSLPLKEKTYDEYLLLSEEELFQYACFGEKMPSSFYGLEEESYWYFNLRPLSYQNESDAVKAIKEQYPSEENLSVSLFQESPFFWVHKTYEAFNDYYWGASAKYLTFKEDACTFDIRNHNSIAIHNPEFAQGILDVYEYSQIQDIAGYFFLASQIDIENSTYSNLKIQIVYGDNYNWGFEDEVNLVKTTWNLSKDLSKATFSGSQTILNVYGETNEFVYPA